jgi:hypothetical protein
MKLLKKLSLFFAAALSASTVICGFSIASKPVIESSSLQFHMGFGISAIVLCFLTIALFAHRTKNA